MICQGVPLPSAGILAERLRAVVETTLFDHEGVRLPITISIGVAGHPEQPVETVAQLIEAADQERCTRPSAAGATGRCSSCNEGAVDDGGYAPKPPAPAGGRLSSGSAVSGAWPSPRARRA